MVRNLLLRSPQLVFLTVAVVAAARQFEDATAIRFAFIVLISTPVFSLLELGLREIRFASTATFDTFLRVRGSSSVLGVAVCAAIAATTEGIGTAGAAWLVIKAADHLADICGAESLHRRELRRFEVREGFRGGVNLVILVGAVAVGQLADGLVLAAIASVLFVFVVQIRRLRIGSQSDPTSLSGSSLSGSSLSGSSLPDPMLTLVRSGLFLAAGAGVMAGRSLFIRGSITSIAVGDELVLYALLVTVFQAFNVISTTGAQLSLPRLREAAPGERANMTVRVAIGLVGPLVVLGAAFVVFAGELATVVGVQESARRVQWLAGSLVVARTAGAIGTFVRSGLVVAGSLRSRLAIPTAATISSIGMILLLSTDSVVKVSWLDAFGRAVGLAVALAWMWWTSRTARATGPGAIGPERGSGTLDPVR
ncbi:MAG: hypothetical protein GY724_25045 [Actinomycetia bacterium]|nr:hypothetical protein [Actinomycetes bacterium]MCP5031069.1 hypothetical protein [Actinomycetes bacterium]